MKSAMIVVVAAVSLSVGYLCGSKSKEDRQSASAANPPVTVPDPVINVSRTTDAKVDYLQFRVYRTRVNGKETDIAPVPSEGKRWVIKVNHDYYIYAEGVESPSDSD